MYPTKEEAMRLLEQGNLKTPGLWKQHSFVVADCARRIAGRCPDLDCEKAYILGLLHDIGRQEGNTPLGHILEGYDRMMELGYEDVARICFSHSFQVLSLDCILEAPSLSQTARDRMQELLDSWEYDDYDRLIQLCDSIAMAEGPVSLRTRMEDVKERYGAYPLAKWQGNLDLEAYFEKKMQTSLREAAQSFSTERLWIRRFIPGDGEDLYSYLSDPQVVEFEPYAAFDRESAVKEAARREGDPHFWAVCLNQKVIGNIYCAPCDFDSWEVGYVFHRQYWGRGYAMESVKEIMDYIFTVLRIHRIKANCDQSNPNSWRLMERLGMRREGSFCQNVFFQRDEAGKPIWKDTYEYAVLAEEWIKG